MKLTIAEVVEATRGKLIAEQVGAADQLLTSVSWDSREIAPDALYVAIVGERADGHDFIAAAASAGARAALVSREIPDCPIAQILVDDVMTAFESLARFWRDKLSGIVVGLTGSTGKTTTKGLLHDVLSAAGSVVATKANQNNELGVPRTLLNANGDTATVVVEMGMRGLGQIESLCAIARPSWGLITNIGESHMELLGSRENIAKAKAELLQALPSGTGVAFINGADGFAQTIYEIGNLEDRDVRAVFFDGSGEGSPSCSFAQNHPYVWATNIVLGEDGCASFTLNAKGFAAFGRPQVDGAIRCKLGLLGFHNVSNAVSAAAVGLVAGLDLAACATALEGAKAQSGRQRMTRAANGALVLDDAYNASPDSMAAALVTFGALSVKGNRIAVLGDMGELGVAAEDGHRRVGTLAAKTPVDKLVCLGPQSLRFMVEGARLAAMNPEDILTFDNLEEALSWLRENIKEDDAVLLKASHYMGFEHLVEGLVS